MPDATRQRRNPLQPGELVQLTDTRGRMNTIVLESGKVFHTHRGQVRHDDLIGRMEGFIATSTNGMSFLVLRPLLDDFVLSMPRGAQVIYPKDAARIVGLANLSPGARVAEAGVGSGALTCSLLRAVGPEGHVCSVERRPEFAEIAQANVRQWFGFDPPNWELVIADFADLDNWDDPLDAAILDMLAPWECLAAAGRALRPGGVLVVYVATTTQMSRVVETLRLDTAWTEPRAEESLMRTWHLEGLAVRPDHKMNGHTGFLVTCRRLAPGEELPARKRRPAPGAYGEDYQPPQ